VFGIGPTEFIIIGVVALMLFSPRELPKILRSAAKFWGSLRNTADEFRDAIMNEEEMHDLRGMLKGGVASVKNAEAAARRELMKARMEMQKAQNKLLKTVKAAEQAKREELAAAASETDASAEAATDAAPATAENATPATDAPATDAPASPEPIAPAGAVPGPAPGRPDIGQAS
jgi:sec-independent protein translocase protein TatB